MLEQTEGDLERAEEMYDKLVRVQEIQDFVEEWEEKEGGRRGGEEGEEVGYYQECWGQMSRYRQMIEEVPSLNSQLGTIQVETNKLKKHLRELPAQVFGSIRERMTETMEPEVERLDSLLLGLGAMLARPGRRLGHQGPLHKVWAQRGDMRETGETSVT